MKMEINLCSAVMKPLLLLAACSLIAFLVVDISGAYRGWSLDTLLTGAASKEGSSKSSTDSPKDRLFGGLLTTAIDEGSCQSRYQTALYWKAANHTPSPYLVERLRRYEALHKKCGPDTDLFKKATQQLKGEHVTESAECSYVVWIPEAGLGNRIISIVSGFLYALLNDKVLLLGASDDLRDIFCEPFPETSWVMTPGDDFPIPNYKWFYVNSNESHGNMLKNKELNNDMHDATSAAALRSFIYLHIMHDSTVYDKMFFTEEAQVLLRRIPWLFLRSNLYFTTGLFLLGQYEDELNKLFPEKDTVFHYLGRYLIHPTNSVWGDIKRYYASYLARADERMGIQVRIFQNAPLSFERMFPQIMNCSLSHEILPELNLNDSALAPDAMNAVNLRAILVVSLHAAYYEKIRSMYYEHSTTTGELIAVYQPSHEETQRTEKRDHNAKALADMYLLSFSDRLVTTGFSTFGYVATGLGGLRPWIMVGPDDYDPRCRRAVSMEPCFLTPPRVNLSDPNSMSQTAFHHVRRCEDHYFGGLKLIH